MALLSHHGAKEGPHPKSETMEKTSMAGNGPRMTHTSLDPRSEVMDQETALNAARGLLRALLKEMCSAPGWRVGTDWWKDRLHAARMARREVDRLEFEKATQTLRGARR